MAFVRFVGIDISKSTIDVAVLSANEKEKIFHEKFKNTKADFQKMKKWVGQVGSDDLSETVFFLEHTGLYSLPVCMFFEELKLSYCLESPLRIARSNGIRRGKTDKTDAIMLVKYLYLHRDQLTLNRIPHKALLQLRALLMLRERFVKAKTLLSVPAKELASFSDKDIYSLTTKQTNGFINEIDKRIKVVEEQLATLIKSDETLLTTYELVKSVPGIGPISAAHLLVYTKCFKAFDDSRKFACYAGLAPFPYSSGTSIRGKTKVSYIANRHIKAILTNCAVVAGRHDKELSAYYKRKMEEGKNKMSVLNAIRNKLVTRIFATVKRGTPFVKTIASSNVEILKTLRVSNIPTFQ